MSDENNNDNNHENKKRIELWEGYWVDVNTQLLDDIDFMEELSEAQRTDNLSEFITLIFAIVGGELVYNEVRQHIINEVGYPSIEKMLSIVEKIGEVFPKAGNRAQRHGWRTSK